MMVKQRDDDEAWKDDDGAGSCGFGEGKDDIGTGSDDIGTRGDDGEAVGWFKLSLKRPNCGKFFCHNVVSDFFALSRVGKSSLILKRSPCSR